MKNKIYKLVVVIIPLALLEGCLPPPGMSELKALCEKDAGEWYAYDEPVYVAGYFYDNPSDSTPESEYTRISSGGFDYLEIQKIEKDITSELGNRSGYFRLYKAAKGDSNCNSRFQRQIERQTSDKRPFGREYCVAVKKIDQPESRYSMVINSHDRYLDDKKNALINRWERTIFDKKEGKKIASLIFYRLYPSLNHPLAYGTSIHCDQERYFDSYRSIHKVLVANKYNPLGK